MTWLVTGGAGYIGAHVVRALCADGADVVVLDDLSTGEAARVAGVPLVVGSTLDTDLVGRTMAAHRVRGVVHLAAKKQVGESVARPLHYYEQNVEGLRRLLEAGEAHGVEAFVFSSSAAVYGAPDVDLVTESTPCAPVNPYGTTKLVGEWMVAEAAAVTGMRHASLRYFNVAGTAAPELTDRGAANLVPMVFQQLTARSAPRVFGEDYDTPDGTCVRDFVHVADIASAHVAVGSALLSGAETALTANVGRGEGVSVRAMVETIRRVTGHTADWSTPTVHPRRPGDPARVVASADTLRDTLGWRARHDVEEMVASAWLGWSSPAQPTG
ncbi:UDP-glucose 4-epimerase GalE [Modestobacter sp. Leaf380]|uniref:UDP-glucose 4-epimerase GalE n=1 Tax=Modestobacter sp. Leaf380 TaxID=1736356 RepID=UPI0007007E05|nr:UDP-glucose 4-epimerase GalE [Modestobacter sp. Leaf380]KQS68458.1 UDP-glucose 4-epimerase [Modestobacter sp. Leaf380]